MILRDKHGWPVEFIKGKNITNFIRAIIITNIKMTKKYAKKTHSIIDRNPAYRNATQEASNENNLKEKDGK